MDCLDCRDENDIVKALKLEFRIVRGPRCQGTPRILHIIGCCMGSASVVLAVDAETNRFQIVWNRLTWGGWSLGCMACRTWFKGTIVTWVCCCAFLGCNSALPGDDGKPCPIPECFWWVAITCSNWGWCRVSLLIWIAVEIGCRSTPGLFMEQSFYILLNSVFVLLLSSGHEDGTWKEVRWECVSWVLFGKWLHMVANVANDLAPWGWKPCPIPECLWSNYNYIKTEGISILCCWKDVLYSSFQRACLLKAFLDTL